MILKSRSASKQAPNSPIFPAEVYSTVDMAFNIPENEIVTTHSVSLSIVLAEPILYLRGFSSDEFQDKPPTMLRGSLIVRVQKPTKIKLINLSFKGIAKTDWPEGIPPKKQEIVESKELHSHVWPLFNASFPTADFTSGANMVRFAKDGSHRMNLATDNTSVSSPPASGSQGSTSRHRSNSESSEKSGIQRISHHIRSNSSSFHSSSDSSESTNAIRAFADRLLRAASPSPTPKSSLSSANRSSSTSNAMFSSRASSSLSHEPAFHGLVPRRSFSKDEPIESETQSKGYRTFEPGEYYYNFELPIPQSMPETIECNFGSVHYYLEATVDRPGTFKTKVHGSKEVAVIRAPSDNNLEISEPIAISKSWEDQLYYEIVISGKAFPIGTHIPIAFKLTPLAKVELHRIRVYITENCEYYCKKKRVHRIEPTKRFMLEELLSKDGLQGNLLQELAPSGRLGPGDTEGCSVEHEMNTFIPSEFPFKKEILHPNSTYENIKVHHWIKVVLRLSRRPAETNSSNPPPKRKHYEISIDSPIHLLDTHCTNSNVYLPAYIDLVSHRPSSSSLRRPIPASEIGNHGLLHENDLARPIHLLRKPSIAPPPFEVDDALPPASLDENDTTTMVSESSTHSITSRSLIASGIALQSVDSLGSSVAPSPIESIPPPPPYESAISGNSSSYSDRFKLYQQQLKERDSNRSKSSILSDHNRGRSLDVSASSSIRNNTASFPTSLPMAHVASAPEATAADEVPQPTQTDNSSVSVNTTGSSGDSTSDSSLDDTNTLNSISTSSNTTSTRILSQRDRYPSTVSSVDIVDQAIDDDVSSFNSYPTANSSNNHPTSVRENAVIDPDDPLATSYSSAFSVSTASAGSFARQPNPTASNLSQGSIVGNGSKEAVTGDTPNMSASNSNTNSFGIDTPNSLSSSSSFLSGPSASNSSANANTTSSNNCNNSQHAISMNREIKEIGNTLSNFAIGSSSTAQSSHPNNKGLNTTDPHKQLFKSSNFSNANEPAISKHQNQDGEETPVGSRSASPVFSQNSSIENHSTDNEEDYNNSDDDDEIYVRDALNRTYAKPGGENSFDTLSNGHRPSIAPLMRNVSLFGDNNNLANGSATTNGLGSLNGTREVDDYSVLDGEPETLPTLSPYESINSLNTNLEGSVGIIGNNSSTISSNRPLYTPIDRYLGLVGDNDGIDGMVMGGGAGATASAPILGRLNSVGDLGLRIVNDLDGLARSGDKISESENSGITRASANRKGKTASNSFMVNNNNNNNSSSSKLIARDTDMPTTTGVYRFQKRS